MKSKLAVLALAVMASTAFAQVDETVRLPLPKVPGVSLPSHISPVPGTSVYVVPSLPSKGYYIRSERDNTYVLFNTEVACTDPVIQALAPAAKRGLFQVLMFDYAMSTKRVEGCSGIEDGVATIKWFDGNGGSIALEELFPLSSDTVPPTVTPAVPGGTRNMKAV